MITGKGKLPLEPNKRIGSIIMHADVELHYLRACLLNRLVQCSPSGMVKTLSIYFQTCTFVCP